MKIKNLFEAAQISAAFAFGRFNPAHQGHIAVWRTVENAAARWYIGTNPSTLGPNDPLTFEQKSAWMAEIYPPITGHIAAEQSVMTLAAKIFADLGKNEVATIAYITDAEDWAWSGKLLNQYNGVEGKHGYYKFAEIVHVPSPRVSSATALRDAARADDKVAFYHASGTDPKLKVAGLTYFDTVKQAVTKYPLPVKKAKKVAEGSQKWYPDAPVNDYTGHEYHKLSDDELERKRADQKERHEKLGDTKAGKNADIAKGIQVHRVRQGVTEGTESSIEKKIQAKQDSLSLAREQRRARGQRQQGPREIKLQAEIDKLNTELTQLKRQGVAEGKYTPASTTEEDILIKGKKVGKITKITTKNGTVFYSAEIGNSSITGADTRQQALRDLKKLISWKNEKGVAEDSLNEFAADGFGDSGDSRSKLLASVGRLLDGGNKVDWQVPGQMGHVTRVQDDGITMKKWKTPHSRMSFFLPMNDDSRDSKYTIKMVAPKHYAVVSAEQGIAEVSTELRNRYVSRASDDYSNANFAARASKDHPGLDDYSREQEQRAKKRAAGLNRALSDKRTGREQNVAEEQKTVAKTWDQMTSQEKLSGVKGRTVWNERTQRYYTVFDIPVKQATDEASLATMRDYFAGDKDARDPYEITKQRLHYSKDAAAQPTKRKEFKSQWEYEQWLKQNKLKQISGVKEDEEAGEVEQQGQLIPFPAGTTKVSVSDVYDWYKLGQVISDLDDADPADFGQGAPETVIAFGSEEEEHKLLPLLQRLGLKLKDIDQPVSEACSADSLYKMLTKRK